MTSHSTPPRGHSQPNLSVFDASKATWLCADASRHGLGFILQQKADNDTWALIQAGSCFLTDAESWYAIIELELLPIYHKVQDVFGCPTTLQGHH